MGSNPSSGAVTKKKTDNQERIFASQLKEGQEVLCDDCIFRQVTKVDPIIDPSGPLLVTNEVIAYVVYSKGENPRPELKSGSVVVRISNKL